MENADAIAKTLKEAGFDVVPFKVDISDKRSVLQLIDAAKKRARFPCLSMQQV